MPRASWKGFIRLSLVSIPVQAFSTSVASGGEIQFHQLHASCHSRIRYQKTCPVHGEVPNGEIVKGYEYAKGQYVVVDPEELDRMRRPSDRAINIDAFVHPGAVDPVYFSGKTYYLTPDGPAGQKPYTLLHRAMAADKVNAVAQVVLNGREELVLLRTMAGLLVMSGLEYAARVKSPDSFVDEIGQADFSKKELELTHSLIEATLVEQFDLAKYKDLYTQRMTELIQMKVEGREVVQSPEEQPAQVINLMDALKASVARAKATERRAKKSAPRRPAGRKRAS